MEEKFPFVSASNGLGRKDWFVLADELWSEHVHAVGIILAPFPSSSNRSSPGRTVRSYHLPAAQPPPMVLLVSLFCPRLCLVASPIPNSIRTPTQWYYKGPGPTLCLEPSATPPSPLPEFRKPVPLSPIPSWRSSNTWSAPLSSATAQVPPQVLPNQHSQP